MEQQAHRVALDVAEIAQAFGYSRKEPLAQHAHFLRSVSGPRANLSSRWKRAPKAIADGKSGLFSSRFDGLAG